jgi:L,D-peptidoglycan transpeptidase YkuD (ErfK/YbiS/YcfS/YnhG family)
MTSPPNPLPEPSQGGRNRPDLRVFLDKGEAVAEWRGKALRCAIGRGAIAETKVEGDGVTPVGRWPLRRVLYRADRLAPPETALPVSVIEADDGWCDDPGDPAYNRPVRLPYAASHERLQRADALYDDPVVPGAGSAIFLHVARDDYGPTEGCVALALEDLLAVLKEAPADSAVEVLPPQD